MATKKVVNVPKGLTKLKKNNPEEAKEISMPSNYDTRPQFEVESEDLPGVKDWKAGEEKTLVVKVKVSRIRSEAKEGDKEPETCAYCTITHIGMEEKE